jgi:hypothetical protein
LHKKQIKITENYLQSDKENTYNLGKVKAHFPAHTFYYNFYIDLKSDEKTYAIHNNTIPVNNPFTLSFDVSAYTAEERQQLFIARLNKDKNPIYETTRKNGTTFTTKTKNLGIYALAADNEPPSITPKNFKNNQWLSNYKYLSLAIKDSISGINQYKATINGKWILMEYEPKTSTLTYNFDDNVIEGGVKHHLEVSVTDNVGNNTIFTATFFRKF